MRLQDDRSFDELKVQMRNLIHLFSHDLRNPLVNITALVTEIRELVDSASAGDVSVLSNEFPEVISLLEQSVERMNAMIIGANDIYHSMFDTVEVADVSLRQLVDRAIERSKKLPGVDFSIGSLSNIQADELAMTRIVEQLVSNAMRAMAEKGGVISISSERRGKNDVIIVRDTGRGMTGEEINRAFDPFYSTTAGAGMGLAIVKALIESHHGRVWCESRLGAGSIFYISLPRS